VWLAVDVVPVVSGVLSPQLHVYDAMVPSESVEVEALTDTVRSLSVWVNAAVGAWLGTLPPPLAKWSETVAGLNTEL